MYSDGARDGNNRIIPVYTPPLDQVGTSVAVIGIETPKSDEPHVTGHDDRVDRTTKVFAPPEFRPDPRDILDLPGLGQWEVIGVPESADGNPWEWNPGSTINVRQVTG